MLLADSKQTFGKSFRIRRLTRDGRGNNISLKVQPDWELLNCDPMFETMVKVTEDKEKNEICLNVECSKNNKDGWFIRYEKVCLSRSLIMKNSIEDLHRKVYDNSE